MVVAVPSATISFVLFVLNQEELSIYKTLFTPAVTLRCAQSCSALARSCPNGQHFEVYYLCLLRSLTEQGNLTEPSLPTTRLLGRHFSCCSTFSEFSVCFTIKMFFSRKDVDRVILWSAAREQNFLFRLMTAADLCVKRRKLQQIAPGLIC